MRIFKFLIITLIITLFLSCKTTYNHKDPYPNMEIQSFHDLKGYVFKNLSSKKLLIILEGSGWDSVLGRYHHNRWSHVGLTSQMIQVLQDRYTIFVPERFNRELGIDYFDDFDDRSRYTFDNVLNSYRESITEYVSQNEYESIVIVGGSEGGIILPILYNQLDNSNISLLISINGGGLSFHESYYIFAKSKIIPNNWKNFYNKLINLYQSKPYPDSLEAGYLGMPFRFWSSIVDIRPFDYYQDIDIPVLFIHGVKDNRIPYESTQFIENNLPYKPFNYIYYQKMRHSELNYRQTIILREDIAQWIIEHDP